MKILLTKRPASNIIASVMSGDKTWGYAVDGICLMLGISDVVPVDEPQVASLYGREIELQARDKKPKVYETEQEALRSGDDISFVLPPKYTVRGPRLMLRDKVVGLENISMWKVNSPSASTTPSFRDLGEQFAIHWIAYSKVLDKDIIWTVASYLQQQQALRYNYRKYLMEVAPQALSDHDLGEVQAKVQAYADRLRELWGAWKDLTFEQYQAMDDELRKKLFVQKDDGN